MRPRTAALAALLSLAAAAAAHAQAAACEPGKLAQKYPSLVGRTIKIGVDPQTPPYVTRDLGDMTKLVGFDADLARAVFDCAGVKYEFFSGGWSGLLPALIAGQIDVFWNDLYYTPERAKQVDYVLYMQAGTGALTQAGNPKKITGMTDLCGAGVAVGLGTVEEPQVKEQDAKCRAAGKDGINMLTFPDVSAGVRLVQSRRVDVMLYDLGQPALARDDGRTGMAVGALSAGKRIVEMVPGTPGGAKGRMKKILIVALARKLLIALWRYATHGVIPEGAVLKPA